MFCNVQKYLLHESIDLFSSKYIALKKIISWIDNTTPQDTIYAFHFVNQG